MKSATLHFDSCWTRWTIKRPDLINHLAFSTYMIALAVFFELLLWQTNATLFVSKVLESSSWRSIALKKQDFGCPTYDTKLHLIVRLYSLIFGMGNIPSLLLLLSSLWLGVVVPVRVPSIGQIEPFNHLLRIITICPLKPDCFAKIIRIR